MNWLDKRSFIQLCILVLLVTGTINGWIASMNIEGVTAQKMHQSDQFFPAPYVIGTVWTLLMLSLAFCFKKLNQRAFIKPIDHQRLCPVILKKASWYFCEVSSITFCGSLGAGACLFQD